MHAVGLLHLQTLNDKLKNLRVSGPTEFNLCYSRVNGIMYYQHGFINHQNVKGMTEAALCNEAVYTLL